MADAAVRYSSDMLHNAHSSANTTSEQPQSASKVFGVTICTACSTSSRPQLTAGDWLWVIVVAAA